MHQDVNGAMLLNIFRHFIANIVKVKPIFKEYWRLITNITNGLVRHFGSYVLPVPGNYKSPTTASIILQ